MVAALRLALLVQAAAAARSGFLNREKYAAVDTERAVADAGGATVKVGAPQHAQVVLHRTEPRAPSMIHDRKRHAWRLWSEGFHAESTDGVAWKQTRLDVKGHVFEDPSRRERKRRYKAFANGEALSSSDGLRFTRAKDGRAPSSVRSAFYDSRRRSYVAYKELGNATSVRYESEAWPGPYASKLLHDAPAVVIPYYSIYVGITDACRFAWSGDALEWTVLPGGVIEECHTPLNPLRDPATGELRVYAFDGKTNSSLTLYRFHADGFAGLRSPSTSIITSRVLPCKGRAPVVTAAITGSLRVAVHDERGDLVQGRSLEDSLPMLLDAVDEEVQWKGAAEPIPGRCVLKFEVKDATLFSFGWISRARDRRQKRVYRERRRVAKAEARGLFRLFVSLSLTTLSCLALRVASLKFCAFFRRDRVKRIQSV